MSRYRNDGPRRRRRSPSSHRQTPSTVVVNNISPQCSEQHLVEIMMICLDRRWEVAENRQVANDRLADDFFRVVSFQPMVDGKAFQAHVELGENRYAERLKYHLDGVSGVNFGV